MSIEFRNVSAPPLTGFSAVVPSGAIIGLILVPMVLVTVLTPLTALMLLAAWILYEAAHRLLSSAHVHGGLVAVIAVLGLASNLGAFLILSRGEANLNVRGARAHVVGGVQALHGHRLSPLIGQALDRTSAEFDLRDLALLRRGDQIGGKAGLLVVRNDRANGVVGRFGRTGYRKSDKADPNRRFCKGLHLELRRQHFSLIRKRAQVAARAREHVA